MFIHNVYFWLKEGLSEEEVQQFEEGVQSLSKIETVRSFHLGKPANTPRDVVDNSFDYSISVHFDDKKGHDFYQDIPLHHQFVKYCAHLWERVQVYDSIV